MTTTQHDAVDVLTIDHHEVLLLVGQIPTADPESRRDMADTVIAELMRHSFGMVDRLRDKLTGRSQNT